MKTSENSINFIFFLRNLEKTAIIPNSVAENRFSSRALVFRRNTVWEPLL
jgi:hypothetical protein